MVAVQRWEANVQHILLTERIAQAGIALLRKELPQAQIDERIDLSPEQLRALIGSYTALIVRSQTRVTSELLAAAPHLQVVGCAGSSLENIDLEAATRRGVLVVNAPRGEVVVASEHTIALLLALAQHIPAANRSIKAGMWETSRFLGVELYQKVLGILGLGRVGQEVAQRAHTLGMHVVAYDPSASMQQAKRAGVTLHDKAEVLQRADFVTLHTALTEGSSGTRTLLGAQQLHLLKPGAYLVNCARGGLIDEEALLATLKEGRLAGVALDVFSQQPLGDKTILSQLLLDERVIVTPHVGASTVEDRCESPPRWPETSSRRCVAIPCMASRRSRFRQRLHSSRVAAAGKKDAVCQRPMAQDSYGSQLDVCTTQC
jgi:D-3-phosphoglycerate dehydrogenase / 2-oxoglutarate reductase